MTKHQWAQHTDRSLDSEFDGDKGNGRIRRARGVRGMRGAFGKLGKRAVALILSAAMLGSVAGATSAAVAADSGANVSASQTPTASASSTPSTSASNTSNTSDEANTNAGIGSDSNAGTVNVSTQNDVDAQREAEKTARAQEVQQSVQAAAKAAPDWAEGHTVAGVSPENTTINLFDYWLGDDPTAADNHDITADELESGINKGRALKFGKNLKWSQYYDSHSGKSNDFNSSTGSNAPRTGMVAPTLNSDGYPQLHRNEAIGISQDKLFSDKDRGSLAYLFNTENGTGKKAYSNVKNLLQVNKGGYYYYDSQQNFAEYDSDANAFNLYDQPAVYPESGNSSLGQFFPFNSADEVFYRNPLQANGTRADDAQIHHYLGMTMSTDFVQPNTGHVDTEGKVPMTYEFSGDDDVWVYIDDVLVGDIGGSHAITKLNIDFSTGEVLVNGNHQAYIGELLKARGKKGISSDGKTLADSSYHTLKFFYLERGNYDSDMSLTFNLVTAPESDVIKVDQNGDPLGDAEFELYSVNKAESDGVKPEDISVPEGAKPLATGETDSKGQLVLKDENNSAIDFNRRYGDDDTDGHANSTYYVLREKSAPKGYSRMTNDMKLKFEHSQTTGGVSGALSSFPTASYPDSSVWDTGAVVRSKETLTVHTSFNTVKDGNECSGDNTCTTSEKLSSTAGKGAMFAVVYRLKNGGDLNTEGDWRAVTGNQVDGWSYSPDGVEGMNAALYAFHTQPQLFELTGSGEYKLELDELPGSLSEYYYMLADNEKGNAKYTVGVYYTTDRDHVDVSNTFRVDTDDFNRAFSSRFYVPNIRNELYVQKVDSDGDPVPGAQFSLYRSDQVTVDGEGTVTINKDANGNNVAAYDAVTTNSHEWVGGNDSSVPSLAGVARFPSSIEDSNKALENGVYYLVETRAPDGMTLNGTVTKVIVQDEGVFVNAGTTGDGVKVVRGTGHLVATLSQYGSTGSMDDTLRYVQTMPRTLTASGDKITGMTPISGEQDFREAKADENGKIVPADGDALTADTATALPLTYGGTGAALEYGARESGGNSLVIADAGWPTIQTYQDSRPQHVDETGLTRTELNKEINSETHRPNQPLSSVVTGLALVQVSNDVDVAAQNRKYITKNAGGTDSYTLHLDVTGATKEITTSTGEADVVLVLDRSGSMTNMLTDGTKRIDALRESVKQFSDTLFPEGESNDKIHVATVLFDGYTGAYQSKGGASNTADAHLTTYGYTTDKQEILNRLPGNAECTADETNGQDSKTGPNGTYAGGCSASQQKSALWNANGTAWNAPLEEVLNSDALKPRDGVSKFVVFVTDGEPNRPAPSFAGAGNNTDSDWGFKVHAYNEAVKSGQKLARQGWSILNVGIGMTGSSRYYKVNPNTPVLNEDEGYPADGDISNVGDTPDWECYHKNKRYTGDRRNSKVECPVGSDVYYTGDSSNLDSNNEPSEYVTTVEALTRHERNASISSSQTFSSVNANDASALTSEFAKIASAIKNAVAKDAYALQKVTITDTLSQWADSAYDAENFAQHATIKATKADGTAADADSLIGKDADNTAGKVPVCSADAAGIKESGAAADCVTVTFDAATRKVTAIFPAGYTLVDGVTYTLSFEVKPSQDAYEQYAKAGKKYCEPTKTGGSDESYESCTETKGEGMANGSDGKGGTGVKPGLSTDDPSHDNDSSKWISTGKEGFYTNVDGVDNVNVSYCVAKNGTCTNQTGKLPYNRPVLRVELGSVEWIKAAASTADAPTLLSGSRWKLERLTSGTLENNPVWTPVFTVADPADSSKVTGDDAITDCVSAATAESGVGDGLNSCDGMVDSNDQAGHFQVTDLVPGTYKLTETTAPDGYVKPADGTYYTFTVTAGTSATSFTGSNDQAKNLLSSLEPEKGSSIPVIHNIQAVSALPLTGGPAGGARRHGRASRPASTNRPVWSRNFITEQGPVPAGWGWRSAGRSAGLRIS